MRLKLLALLALAGCPSGPDVHPFRVVEPVANATLDRCNVRVRTNFASNVQDEGVEALEHINWRIDGGREAEARLMADKEVAVNDANTIFGVTLGEGAQMLEIGVCDEFDVCAWTPVPVTVANAIGAPDCRAYHGGHQMFEQSGGSLSRLLPDGRLALFAGVDDGVRLMLLGPDGQVDRSFGADGVVSIPWLASHAVPHPDGGLLLLGAGFYVARVSAAGVYDTTWGNVGGTPGVRTVTCPGTGGCIIGAIEPAGQELLMGGVMPVAEGSQQMVPFVMRVDRELAVISHTVLDAGMTAGQYEWRHFTLDASGKLLAVAASFAIAGDATGVDTAFGTNGRVDLPTPSLNAVGSLTGDQALIVRQTYIGNDLVVELRPFVNGAARPPIVLSVATSPNVDTRYLSTAIDAAGRAYVAFSRERPPEPKQFSEGAGTELVVARLVDGAIDPTFGAQGYATSTGRDLFERVSSESVSNDPTAIVLGPDGAPWVSAIVQSSTDTLSPHVRRPPRLTLAKLRL